MLIHNLFNIITYNTNNTNEYLVTFNCNSKHNIFEGHFPQEPILPGVCMIQFVRECTEEMLKIKLQFLSSRNVKFINIINPNIETKLELLLLITKHDNDFIEVNAKIKNDTKNFFQIRSSYKIINN